MVGMVTSNPTVPVSPSASTMDVVRSCTQRETKVSTDCGESRLFSEKHVLAKMNDRWMGGRGMGRRRVGN